jgi:hypothetical protein
VIFALSLMISQSGNSVIDGRRQNDSTAAFFAAESGLETAMAGVTAAAQAGSYTDASCTGLVGTTTNTWGTVTLSAVSTPATCDNSGATPCTSCSVTSTGQVRQATRAITLNLPLTTENGITCNGATRGCGNTPTVTWELKLKNGAAVAGVGVFNLTYIRQGNNTPTCAAGSNCRLELSLSSPSNGTNSTGLMGNAVLIPAGSTYPIYQTMSKPQDNLAEVGVFFYGTSAPTLTGQDANPGSAAFWDDNKNSSTRTVGPSGATTGGTNDGTYHASGDSCNAPGSHNQNNCQTWCYGGDTLVYLFAGNVTTLSDQLSGVSFGSGAQSMAMTRLTKYPTTTDTGAPTNVDSEIWYAGNPNLVGTSPLGAGASSWKGRGTAAVGAQWTTNSASETSITTSGTTGNGTLTIAASSAFAGTWPAQVILPGDTISMTSGSTTVTATIGAQSASSETGGMSTGQGGRGTYAVSNIRNNGVLVTTSGTTFNGNNRTWIVSSTVLNVTVCSICFLAQTDPVTLTGLGSGRTINAAQSTPAGTYGRTEVAGGLGRYPLSGIAIRVASNTGLFVGTPGTTLYLPSTSSQPAVTTPNMLVTVKSGTGTMAPGTRVTATASPNAATQSFTVTTLPTTALDNATVCAGICALFVPGGTTPFSLSGVTSNFNEWASGFMCLQGVDIAPQIVTSSSAKSSRWTEVVQ